MKYTLLTAAMAIGIFSFAANNANADIADTITNKLSSGLSDSVKQQLCSKGSRLSNVSIRSGEGKAAHVKILAAIGELVCGKDNVQGYNDSKFHKIAEQTLGGAKPEDVIKESIKDAHSVAFKAFCTHKDQLPENIKFIANSCPAAEAK